MSLKALANKIASMTNMEKITSSMKMVAAAKMKGTELRLEAGKPFGQRIVAAAFPQPTVDEETLDEDAAAQMVTDSDTNAFVVISSDRGLCGGVNSAVVKCTKAAMEKLAAEGKADAAAINIVGDKARGGLERVFPGNLGCTMDETWAEPPSFAMASAITSRVLASEADRVHVVFNTFKSAIAYQPTIFNCENYHAFNEKALDSDGPIYPAHLEDYEFEPENSTEALQNMYEFALAGAVFNGMIEGQASEESSRMAAMDNASKNAVSAPLSLPPPLLPAGTEHADYQHTYPSLPAPPFRTFSLFCLPG